MLSINNLTDLSALYLADVIKRRDHNSITQLDISSNYLSFKAGVFLGQALIENPDCGLSKLFFTNVSIEEDGLTRVLTGIN